MAGRQPALGRRGRSGAPDRGRACAHPGQPGGQRGAGLARLSAGPCAARWWAVGLVRGTYHSMKQFFRGATIVWVVLRFGLDELVLTSFQKPWLRLLARTVSVGRDLSAPRGQRLREALERLGPIFVKFGQVLSTRRDLVPPDLADELALLQDRVPPFDSGVAVATIEAALGRPLDVAYREFERTPVAVKVLRLGIAPVIAGDVSLMVALAWLVEKLFADGKRLRPREVVAE